MQGNLMLLFPFQHLPVFLHHHDFGFQFQMVEQLAHRVRVSGHGYGLTIYLNGHRFPLLLPV
jgi:hypothetical protein